MCSIPKQDKVSDVYTACENLPERFNKPACVGGYGQRTQHPLYKTTQNEYGRLPPNVHTMPTCFYGSNTKFTEGNLRFGMFRYHGLNTELDKSRVMDTQPPNFG